MTEEEFFAVEENGKYCIARTFYDDDTYKQIVVECAKGRNRINISYSFCEWTNTINEIYQKPLSKITYDEAVAFIDKYYKKWRSSACVYPNNPSGSER